MFWVRFKAKLLSGALAAWFCRGLMEDDNEFAEISGCLNTENSFIKYY